MSVADRTPEDVACGRPTEENVPSEPLPVRPTVRAVAARAGVSSATVSRVMRGATCVTVAQREKVLRAAQALNYRWNPAASNLMSQLRRGHVAVYREKIAWLNPSLKPRLWQEGPWFKSYYQGALGRAEAAGILIEPFWLEDPALGTLRLDDIFRARGIHGLIVPWHHPALDRLDWSRYAVVALRTAALPHALHVIGPDYMGEMHIAYQTLRRRGYVRIGLMLHPAHDAHTGGCWRAAFLLENTRRSRHNRVPILTLPQGGSVSRPELFVTWIRGHKLDAVLCCDEFSLGWAREAGFRVPDALGLAHLGRHDYLAEWAGIDRREREIGAAAIDLIIGQLSRGERGTPPFQKKVAIQGRWVDGPSVRPAPACAGPDAPVTDPARRPPFLSIQPERRSHPMKPCPPGRLVGGPDGDRR